MHLRKVHVILTAFILTQVNGISVPQPVVLPPPVPHVRIIPPNQRHPILYSTSNSLHRPIVASNLVGVPPRNRGPPTGVIFDARDNKEHQSDQDVTEYPRYIQRQPSPPQFPHQKGTFITEDISPKGLPVNLQHPRFEYGFVPLTSNRVPQSTSNVTSIRRNITYYPLTSRQSNIFKNYVVSTQANVYDILKDFNTTFEENCRGTKDLGWCDLGKDYPTVDIQHVLTRCSNLLKKLYVEIPESELIETGGESDLEEANKQNNKERKNFNLWSWSSYHGHGGSLCDAQRKFIKPSMAKDINGKWLLIIQSESYPQRVPLEMCRKTGEPCSKIGSCAVKSLCVQKYTYQPLISVDPQKLSDCPFMNMYKFPSLCICHVDGNNSLTV